MKRSFRRVVSSFEDIEEIIIRKLLNIGFEMEANIEDVFGGVF